METSLDRFGRVVIPKAVRQRLGITPGQALEIDEGYDQIILRPVRPRADLEVREGVLVYSGGELEGEVGDVVKADRERRIAKLIGNRPR